MTTTAQATPTGDLAPFDLLLAHFDQLIRRPADIPRLNELILRLAVQGKLVPQDPADEPASKLLPRIAAEKARLVAAGEIRKSEPLPPIGEDEVPFEVPTVWIWVRLDDIGDWGAGATPKRGNLNYYENGTIPWLKTGELNDGYIDKAEEYITELALKENSLRFNKPGDILIAMYGATIGKLGILEIAATTNQACCACTPFSGVFNRYLFYYLRSLRANLKALGAGGAQPNISRQKIIATPIPLPPLAEQRRIVERVETLLEQTRALAAELAAAETEQAALNRASLHHLTGAASAAELSERWAQLAASFDDLYTGPAAVAELKQAILQLAVQGKLAAQNPADEPASQLLQRIEAEKQRLVAAGKIQAENPLPPIDEVDIPFEVPTGWEWCRLADVCKKIQDGTHHSPQQQYRDYAEGRYLYLTSKNIKFDGLDFTDVTYIDEEFHRKVYQRCDPEKGDILLVKDGAMTGTVTINDLDDEFSLLSSVALLKPFKDAVCPSYIKYYLQSPIGLDSITGKMSGSAIPRIILRKIKPSFIPLPPLAEQRRIVARVEQLLGLCDDLKAQLAAGESARARLVEELVNCEL